MDRLKSFTRLFFDLALVSLQSSAMDMRTFPMQKKGTGGCGAIVRMERCSSGGNFSLFCFVCADCAVEAGRAAGLFLFAQK